MIHQHRRLLVTASTVLALFSLANIQPAAAALLSADNEKLVQTADLNYSTPVASSEEGMPIGNGRTGTLLWTDPRALRMQINRVDVFGNDCTSASFPQRNTDYCGGCGFVALDFAEEVAGGAGGAGVGDPVFPNDHFAEHLSCYDGLATVTTPSVAIEAQAWNEQDVIALRVTDHRDPTSPSAIVLSMLRPPVVTRGNHTAASILENRGNRILLTQKFTEGNYYCGSVLAIQVLGRDVDVTQRDDQTLRLTLRPGAAPFTVFISSAASMDPTADLASQALTQLTAAATTGFDGISQSNRLWWSDFWSKSLVHIHSADHIADRLQAGYLYDLYIMASTSRGKYPAKFNGMLWTTGGDKRTWGGAYWGANQSCNYNTSLFASNHADLMAPMFDMYTAMSASLAQAAIQQWGSQGIYIPETVAFDGLAPLPADIASEMRDLYLLQKPWSSMSDRFRQYAYAQQPFSSRWNWMAGGKIVDGKWIPGERGAGPYGPVTHILSRGAKIAYEYWQQYEYTQDHHWLADRAYPMLKGVAEFYRNYPNLKRSDSDGRYHIHNVNANEGLWGGQDTDEEISSMMAIFATASRASEILNVDPDLRAQWQAVLADLAPLPLSDNPAATTQYVGDDPQAGGARYSAPEADPSGPPRWVRALAPVKKGAPGSGSDGNTLPIWYFDLCTLETTGPMRDTGIATANRFFRTRSFTRPATTSPTSRGSRGGGRGAGVLSRVPLLAAIMGRADQVKTAIPRQMLVGEVPILPNRMDLREGAQTQGIERLGNASEALLAALCQSVPPSPAQPTVIHVFPAWPPDWDADFTLLARGNFLVSSSMHAGQIQFVEILSQSGGDCRIRNPWPDSPVTLFRNNTESDHLTGNLLVVPTTQGDDIILCRPNTTPDQFRRNVTDPQN